nr:MAG TPA: hypothetical protein [Caudoviricetes sp.]
MPANFKLFTIFIKIEALSDNRSHPSCSFFFQILI